MVRLNVGDFFFAQFYCCLLYHCGSVAESLCFLELNSLIDGLSYFNLTAYRIIR